MVVKNRPHIHLTEQCLNVRSEAMQDRHYVFLFGCREDLFAKSLERFAVFVKKVRNALFQKLVKVRARGVQKFLIRIMLSSLYALQRIPKVLPERQRLFELCFKMRKDIGGQDLGIYRPRETRKYLAEAVTE